MIQNVTLQKQEWRDMRGYLISDVVELNAETGTVAFTGFLKGSPINANQLIHITGYDDYQIE